ncbi:uncharacterized protein MONOS_13936 [Monocercomonoides exilis]|uniref:uncharacterized protein n=1 Tax=Monocercomonoides exilis TaxID=2049356 RepID=UPI00355A1CF4|nr:hypothetical protein MONOS_13936 [Monocercomonoides exilis]|eukprot:MONOS_13936.1-p1 / transcript=MONOS_13936.1 / gene=MONOS_13936 / organism=Monocercomonoides_exilis_PA203 / gene_product=unspecified product / transcript_product=unspecified product / location=Mono_scaffold00907:620-1459(-) / protein_length=184 / sequence_SO=supercontig / SO=protein_coding / is_pseudo=false
MVRRTERALGGGTNVLKEENAWREKKDVITSENLAENGERSGLGVLEGAGIETVRGWLDCAGCVELPEVTDCLLLDEEDEVVPELFDVCENETVFLSELEVTLEEAELWRVILFEICVWREKVPIFLFSFAEAADEPEAEGSVFTSVAFCALFKLIASRFSSVGKRQKKDKNHNGGEMSDENI